MQDALGNRMKENYENVTRNYLPKRTNAIIRLDGRAFHTLTRNCKKPFDDYLMTIMAHTAKMLCNEISGVKFAYTQSDEISLLLTDYDTLYTQQWFGGNIQKIASVSASIATAHFNDFWQKWKPQANLAMFDSRVFIIPEVNENVNYFIWRQKDWTRNSLSMLAQNHFSHSELQGKNSSDKHEMLHEIGVNWADLPLNYKNGTMCRKLNQFEPEAAFTFTQNWNSMLDLFPKVE